MQISRHWRMKALRYRLEGVRVNTNDTTPMQNDAQAASRSTQNEAQTNAPTLTAVKRAATAAR
ncbi:MAG: hypothetical protein SGI73_04610 [Chloroflexota bacterium]|nr:hypothetical protein [Chloroflexota bacterium]